MASRTSARTAASRNQATSPPRQPTRSPVVRKARTRSASVELESAAPIAAKREKRSKRQGSVESVESNISAGSSNQGGRRKKTKRGEVAYPELSIVVEGAEDTEEQREENEAEEEAGSSVGSDHPPHSPGRLSQMSGTTASYSAMEVERLDLTMVVEVLPGLWSSSIQLLSLLAPENATGDSVESVVRSIKVPGSALAKILKHREDKFDVDKSALGKDDYIRSSFILQKLFNSTYETSMPRPDAILQAANLATLVKNLLVAPKEAISTFHFFSSLDTWFPESFVTQFEDNVEYGNSTMLSESFALALEIRTQYAIACLLHHKSNEQELHPDEILVEPFFEQLSEHNPLFTYFDDYMTNAKLKNLMRTGPVNTDAQNILIRKRVEEIHKTFRRTEAAAKAGDLVDFDRLEKRFPWSTFLYEVVQWTSFRIAEIEAGINQHGGIDKLVESLVESIKKSNDDRNDLILDPQPSTAAARKLLPPADIVTSNAGHSLFTPGTIRALERLRKNTLASALNQGPRPTATSSSVPASSLAPTQKSRHTEPSRSHAKRLSESSRQPRQVAEDLPSFPVNDDKEITIESVDRRAASTFNNYDHQVTNKENYHQPRFLDAQANARKVEWGSQSVESQQSDPKRLKRKQQDIESDDESASQDEGFQTDSRNIYSRRKIEATVISNRQHLTPPPQPGSRKRARAPEEEFAAEEENQADGDDERAAQEAQARHRRQHAQSQTRASQQAVEDLSDFENDAPQPSAAQVATMARTVSAVARRAGEPQSRTPWSEKDTDHLIDLIEELGCSWVMIWKAGDFEVERGQVALKDKARNLKVQYLRADIPLPPNFDKIPLGQKEIRSVQSVRPDYTP